MTIIPTINFNNRSILQGHLEQALPQVFAEKEVESINNRLVLGTLGGLGYKLFPDFNELPSAFSIRKFKDIGQIQDYLVTTNRYISAATDHAKKFGFEMLSIEDLRNPSERVLRPVVNQEDYVYCSAIGSPEIAGSVRFNRFIDMLEQGYDTLNNQYSELKKLGSGLEN